MRKIFKPENVVKNMKTVMIPDVEFKQDPEPLMNDNGEPKMLTKEIYEEIKKELRNEVKGELNRKRLNAAHECDRLIAKAKKEAKLLTDDAAVSRKRILDEANESANKIKADAYKEGLQKGIAEKSEMLDSLSQAIVQSIKQLKANQEDYLEEYARQLKFLASEISEKVIYQKIQDDDMIMYGLIKNAVKTVRNASWIKAEVSGKLSGYIDSLEKELSDSGIRAEISINDSAPPDTCIINTSEGFVDASVSKQLENLKDFIDRQDKSGNDEETS